MGRMMGAALAALALMLGASSARAGDSCDRACLEGFVNRYLDAVVAHDPSRLALAAGVRFTENGQELHPGDGLWGTASGLSHYKIYVSDIEAGQAGFQGMVLENGVPVLLALRLKIEDQVITEIETIVVRPTPFSTMPTAGALLQDKQPRPQFSRTVPAAERMSRQDLIRISDAYFTGLAANSGRNTAPFARTCERLENAMATTNNAAPALATGDFNVGALGCDAQQKSGFFAFVTQIRNRRFPIVDRERGLVMAFGFFEHNGRMTQVRMVDGKTAPSPVLWPQTLHIAELFQIDKGQLDQIEAVINFVPYGMTSDVWDQP